jgi:hypothetical protein
LPFRVLGAALVLSFGGGRSRHGRRPGGPHIRDVRRDRLRMCASC